MITIALFKFNRSITEVFLTPAQSVLVNCRVGFISFYMWMFCRGLGSVLI